MIEETFGLTDQPISISFNRRHKKYRVTLIRTFDVPGWHKILLKLFARVFRFGFREEGTLFEGSISPLGCKITIGKRKPCEGRKVD